MAEYLPLIISALLYHCFSRLSRRAFLFFSLFGGFFSVKAPKTPRRAALCRFRGRDRRGRSLPVQDILHPRRRRKILHEDRNGTTKKAAPAPPRGGTETAFSLFLGRGRGHFLSSCSCRETRSIMRAYPSAPYTRHLRTRVIVAEETPVCSLMALNVSPS